MSGWCRIFCDRLSAKSRLEVYKWSPHYRAKKEDWSEHLRRKIKKNRKALNTLVKLPKCKTNLLQKSKHQTRITYSVYTPRRISSWFPPWMEQTGRVQLDPRNRPLVNITTPNLKLFTSIYLVQTDITFYALSTHRPVGNHLLTNHLATTSSDLSGGQTNQMNYFFDSE